jgi:uncharacterized phage-associated protein
MVDILEVAKYFTSIDSVDHKKLQKLCYYSQCWYCGLYNKAKLANTDFEAWIHGPVSPTIYHTYKKYGWYDIPKTDAPTTLTPDIIAFLNSVYGVYGKFSGDELEMLSHNEKPWINARAGLEPTQSCTNVLNLEDMYTFCKEKTQESN